MAEPAAEEGRIWPWRGYGTDWPIAGYGVLVTVFATLFALPLLAAPEARLPSDLSVADWARLAVATHKIGRIIAMDWVTIPVRAPFVEFAKDLHHGEVVDKARGSGLRAAIGQLLT